MKAICIVSGGIDSISSAALMKSTGEEIHAITFNYGQKATREILQAKDILEYIGVKEHKIIDVSFLNEIYGDSNSLTSVNLQVSSDFKYNLVVPLRNMIFISIASAWAFSKGGEMIVYGAHLSDNPYPDCRVDFALDLEALVNKGEIDSIKKGERKPLMFWSPAIAYMYKQDLIIKGHELLGDKIFDTWSCYLDEDRHCGQCESCRNRKNAFQKAGIVDKTEYKI